MAVNHVRHLSQGRADTLRGALEGVLQVTEQPGAALAAATNHHAVHAGLLDHAHGVLGGENIAVAQNRHVGNQFAQLGDGIPVGLTRIVLGGGAAVQGNRGHAGIARNLGGFEERDVGVVDALAHLNGQRNIVAGGFFDRRLHNRGEQVGLPG